MNSRLGTFLASRRFARVGVPVYRNLNNALCFKRETGPNQDPVMIVSVPKSGTYLFAEILSALGVQSVDIHVGTDGFQDLRDCSKERAVARSADLVRAMSCEHVLPLILPGQFLVSHFPCLPRVIAQLDRFKTIFTYRSLRDVLVSVMRWVARKAQAGDIIDGWERLPDCPDKMQFFMERYGASYLGTFATMRDWIVQPGVLSISFEEIQGDFGPAVQASAVERMLDFMGLRVPSDQIGRVLAQCLGKETLTFSGKRSNHRDVWSDKVEDLFQQHGGGDLNAVWTPRPARTEAA
jgi:Sulfotransferase domain